LLPEILQLVAETRLLSARDKMRIAAAFAANGEANND
jgi:hypothetical protein